jgi:hypothetical protein
VIRLIAGVLAALPSLAALAAADRVWITQTSDDGAVLMLASPEASDDILFILSCNNIEKSAGMTVFVEIAGTKVEEPVTIELLAESAKHTVEGHISTDELAGFNYADAKDMDLKPVIAVLSAEGPATVKAGQTVTTLPDKGRAAELANAERG